MIRRTILEVEVGYNNPRNRSTNGPRSLARRADTPGFAFRLEKGRSVGRLRANAIEIADRDGPNTINIASDESFIRSLDRRGRFSLDPAVPAVPEGT